MATPENIARAIRFIDKAPGSGGTELGSAIDQALAILRDAVLSRTIALVTDGYIL